jgi:hypothetical protein
MDVPDEGKIVSPPLASATAAAGPQQLPAAAVSGARLQTRPGVAAPDVRTLAQLSRHLLPEDQALVMTEETSDHWRALVRYTLCSSRARHKILVSTDNMLTFSQHLNTSSPLVSPKEGVYRSFGI